MSPLWPCRKTTRCLPPPAAGVSLRGVELVILGSGSNGNTAVVRADDCLLLLDAGLGARKTLQRLAAHGIDPAEIDAVLLTHEHGDHAGGLPVLLRSLRCPVYATRLTADEVRGQDPRNAAADWRIFATGCSFTLGRFEVTAFSVPHDANDPVGFTLRTTSASMALLTDLGHINHSVVHHVTGVDCLFIEANHDEQMLQADTKRPFSIKQRILSPHGHLSNRAAGELAARAHTPRLQHVVLGHLSRDCNEPALAVETVRGLLETSVTIVAAAQDEVTVVGGIGA